MRLYRIPADRVNIVSLLELFCTYARLAVAGGSMIPQTERLGLGVPTIALGASADDVP